MLNGKNIVIGVTGGIAVYKIVDLVSQLRKKGANVKVIMSKAAMNFVTPLMFQEISKNPVITSMWQENENWDVEHIAIANWADCIVIAPATANIIGKVANGIADDMLTTVVMATKVPIIFAPAMNTNMYVNPIVQKNLATLRTAGYHIVEPAKGMLACGIEGIGRLPEVPVLLETLEKILFPVNDLKGKKILVTAAGTIEPIDPVRYIGNRSSGKMGYAIAKAAHKRGAEVVLISGPSALNPIEGIRFYKIESAKEMHEIVIKEFTGIDIVIKAAAVADYRAKEVAVNKIKKNDESLTLVLEKNPDILMELGQKKKVGQILVGFAAETQELVKYAQDKMKRKNLDMIVANDITMVNAGFNADTNIVKLLYKNGRIESIPQMSKESLADVILDKILQNYY